MKKTLLTIIYLLFLPLLVLSQDIIVKTSGDSINCMVTEVNDEEVLYKIWGQAYGPGYSIPKRKVYKIKFRLGHELVINDTLTSKLENEQIPLAYHPGLFRSVIFQNDEKLNSIEIENLMMAYPKAVYQYRKGKKMNAIGITIGTLSVALFGIPAAIIASDGNKYTTWLVAGGAGLLTGTILAIDGNNTIKKAVATYNSEIDKTQAFRLEFGMTRNGFGLCLLF